MISLLNKVPRVPQFLSALSVLASKCSARQVPKCLECPSVQLPFLPNYSLSAWVSQVVIILKHFSWYILYITLSLIVDCCLRKKICNFYQVLRSLKILYIMDFRALFSVKLCYYCHNVQCYYCSCRIIESSGATIFYKKFEWQLLEFLTTRACLIEIKKYFASPSQSWKYHFWRRQIFWDLRHDVCQLRKNPQTS